VGWLYIDVALGRPNAHFNFRFGTCAAEMPAAFADWKRALVASALHPFHDGLAVQRVMDAVRAGRSARLD
jgi:hypothetical protein